MREHDKQFSAWLKAELPQVHFLRNESISLGGVNFFGGTMWTDFRSGDANAMRHAATRMNDFRLIRDDGIFTPEDSLAHHQEFIGALESWFAQRLPGPRVVITHHAPVENPKSRYLGTPLLPAFVACDMKAVIETHAPAIWIYGHSHECDAQKLSRTRILSNQLGYPSPGGGYECSGTFDEYGCMVEIS